MMDSNNSNNNKILNQLEEKAREKKTLSLETITYKKKQASFSSFYFSSSSVV
jgi:hypothetical protein